LNTLTTPMDRAREDLAAARALLTVSLPYSIIHYNIPPP
jgi:hypothetical protein